VEAGAEQEVAVLLEPIRDQHVLERLALLGDLELAVAHAALERVIALDEETVEQRAVAEHLLDQQEARVLVHARVNPAHQLLAVQRPDEHQREDHQHDGRVLDLDAGVEVALPKLDDLVEVELGELLPAAIEHLGGIVDADEVRVDRQRLLKQGQRRARRATEVIDVRAFGRERSRELGEHPLHLAVEWHAARHHVVEHARDRLVEREVADLLELIAKDLVDRKLSCHARPYPRQAPCGRPSPDGHERRPRAAS
jgi:hypothetical protein